MTAWYTLQYPQREFGPPLLEDLVIFDPAWMAAIDQSTHQTGAIPEPAIPYYFWLPSVFFQMEPDDQINPVYYESWSNLSTQLMPNVRVEELFGEPYNYPSVFFQQEPRHQASFEAAWSNLSTWLMPNVRIEELFGEAHIYPYFFGGNIEPSDQVNPRYFEAWGNQSTWVMPQWRSEALHGEAHNYPPVVWITPEFLIDGTAVQGPTRTEPDFPSRTTTEPE